MSVKNAWMSSVAIALKAECRTRDASGAAESLAREFREKYRIVGPIDVHAAAKLLDARVAIADISADASLSSAYPPYLIRVARRAPEVRKRFSIAHELGHIALFRRTNVLEAFSHAAAGTDVVPSAQREVEILCDRFASELLMPAAEWTRITRRYGASIQVLRRLTTLYKVSFDAAARRLVEAGGWRCAVIIWEVTREAASEPVLKPIRFYRTEFLNDEGWPITVTAVSPIGESGMNDRNKSFQKGEITFGIETRNVCFQSGWLKPQRILATILLGGPGASTSAAKFYTPEALKELTAWDLILPRARNREQYRLDIDS